MNSIVLRYQKLSCLIFLTCMQFSKAFTEPLSISVHAEAAILMNADTGQILYEKNAYTPHFPASITKIATAAYALKKKSDSLDVVIVAEQECIASISPEAKRRSNFTMPSYWVEQGSNHMGIKRGEELTLKDLLYGMMMISANDASNIIAHFVGGSIPTFMKELNEWIKDIGCKNTTFYNPNGLHHPKHQTTAYDMALITREGLKDPIFNEIVSTVRYTRPKTNKQEPTTLVHSNLLLRNGRYKYPKAIGVKTGGTFHASNTFVTAARHDGRTLILVFLETKERNHIYEDAIKVFEAAFNQQKVQRVLLKAGEQNFVLNLPEAANSVKTYTKESLSIEYYPAEEPQIKCLLYWDELKLPMPKDAKVGELHLENNRGELMQKISLYSAEEMKSTWSSWFKSFF